MNKPLVITTSTLLSLLLASSSGQPAEQPAYSTGYQGSIVTISTCTGWLSNDPQQIEWIVVEPGIPTEVKIIDQPYIEEVSHMETVHHDAVTHQEKQYGTRTVWTMNLIRGADETLTVSAYSQEELIEKVNYYIANYDYNPAGDISSHTERYVVATNTVVDIPAYDEEVLVIDVQGQEEISHTEIIMEGAVGYYANRTDLQPLEGDGHFTTYSIRKTVKTHSEE